MKPLRKYIPLQYVPTFVVVCFVLAVLFFAVSKVQAEEVDEGYIYDATNYVDGVVDDLVAFFGVGNFFGIGTSDQDLGANNNNCVGAGCNHDQS